jgi:hypothetical protein
MALILIAVSVVVATASGVSTVAHAQNVTSRNTTVGNSTEGLPTSEERGAYSEYGG